MIKPESSPRLSQASPASPHEEAPTHEVRIEATKIHSTSKASFAEDFVGTVVAGYEIISKLGQGGMGAVYKARHLRLDKLVALKLLPSYLLQDQDSVQRFEREMRALGKLEHPHLVQAYDAGDADGLFYLALELIEGGDLSQYVKKQGTLPIRDACRLIRQAALALDYVHQQGMVHRDVKPANLMLTKSGQLKVSDLGLARLTHDDAAAEALTHTGVCMGTPDYMAPEQWDNTHAVDGRADLYALGCTLFFLLVGRAPWQTQECGTMPSKLKAHVMGPIPPLQPLRPEVPPPVEAIYQKLLAKQPEQRFATGKELADALAPFAETPGDADSSTFEIRVNDPQASVFESPQPTRPTITLATRPAAQGRRAVTKGAGSGRVRLPPGWLLGLGGGGMALLLFGIVLKITLEDGTTTEIPVPENARIEIIQNSALPAMAKGGSSTKLQATDAVAPQHLTKDEVERKVAEWALASGGKGLAYINGARDKWHTLEAGNLPSEPFSIFVLILGKGASSDDYEMSLLPQLKMLGSLGVTADESRKNLFTKLLPVHSLRSLSLTQFPADGSLLPKFSNLTQVKLHSPPSPADLEALAQLPNLYSLEIEWFQGEDIRFLSTYPVIRTVYFNKPRIEIDESTARELQRQKPDLRIIVGTDQGQRHLGTDTNRHAAAQLFAAGVVMKIRPIPYSGGEKVATQDDFDSSRPFLVEHLEFPLTEPEVQIPPELFTQIDYWGDLRLPSYNTTAYVQAVSAQRRITLLSFAPSTRLDAAAIEAIQKMTWLRRLFLGTTDLTADQVAQIRTALPYTEIYSAFGTFPPLADETSP